MRKHLLAVLSIFGLASSPAPASAQVLKGSTPADTKSESTVKKSKTVQEDAASKDAAKMTKLANEQKSATEAADEKHKAAISSVEGGHATSDVVSEKRRKAGGDSAVQDFHKKQAKSAAEMNAAQGASNDKWRKAGAGNTAVSDELAHKGKAQMGDGSVKPATVKGEKVKAETNAAAGDHIKKGINSAGETQAAQQAAGKKAAKQVDQASPK